MLTYGYDNVIHYLTLKKMFHNDKNDQFSWEK
jgi:hypothetical protein